MEETNEESMKFVSLEHELRLSRKGKVVIETTMEKDKRKLS